MNNLRLHNVSIHMNFYQNRFTKKCTRINLAKLLEGRRDGRSFFCEMQKNLLSQKPANYFAEKDISFLFRMLNISD